MRWKSRHVCGRLLKIFYFYMTIFWVEKRRRKRKYEMRNKKEKQAMKRKAFLLFILLSKKSKIRRARKKLNEERNEKTIIWFEEVLWFLYVYYNVYMQTKTQCVKGMMWALLPSFSSKVLCVFVLCEFTERISIEKRVWRFFILSKKEVLYEEKCKIGKVIFIYGM